MNRGVISFLFVIVLFSAPIQTNGLQKDLGIEVGDQIEYGLWEDEWKYYNGSQGENYFDESILTYEVTAIDTNQDLINFDVVKRGSKLSYQTSEPLDQWNSKVIYTDFEYWRMQLENMINETQPNYFEVIDNDCDFGLFMLWNESENLANQTISYEFDSVQIYTTEGILIVSQKSLYTDYSNGTAIYQFSGIENRTDSYCEYTEDTTEYGDPRLPPPPENPLFPGKSTTPTLSAKLPGFKMYFVFSLGLIILAQKRSIK